MDLKYKLGILIVILIFIAYLAFIPSNSSERIQIAGSTSVQPVAEKLATEIPRNASKRQNKCTGWR